MQIAKKYPQIVRQRRNIGEDFIFDDDGAIELTSTGMASTFQGRNHDENRIVSATIALISESLMCHHLNFTIVAMGEKENMTEGQRLSVGVVVRWAERRQCFCAHRLLTNATGFFLPFPLSVCRTKICKRNVYSSP